MCWKKLWEGERSDNDYRDMMILFFDPIIRSCWKKQHSHTPFMFFRDWLKKICEANNAKKIALSLIAKQSFFARVLGWLHTRNWWHMMAHDHHDHSKIFSRRFQSYNTTERSNMLHLQNTWLSFFTDFSGSFRDLYIFQIKLVKFSGGWYLGGSSQAVVE